jgi:2-dehydro-3-deoxyphosphogalactonate aldolase
VTPDSVLPVCEALMAGGVRFIEVTLNSPDPIASIRKAAEALTPKGARIGAGTVLTPEEVDRVADAGGAYIISPNTNEAVIRCTKERGLISIPGFLTPSEAFAAVAAGADMVKCFPIGCMGPGYIKDLKAVLPAPVVAVGGVSRDNAREFLQAGAVAVGVGSALYRPDGTPRQIASAAAAFMACMRP